MTITTHNRPASGAASTSGIDWTVVQSGLWVGNTKGEFAGMIEAQWDEGYLATTRLGKHLGKFATVDEAKASFTG